jgi:uncharacterized protein
MERRWYKIILVIVNDEKANSAIQAIDKTCFSKDGLLTDEFESLYSSLFDLSEHHIKIVRLLAVNDKGLSRQQLIEAGRLPSTNYPF